MEEWFAQGMVTSLSDPKYREMVAIRRALRAEGQEMASKRTKAKATPQTAAYSDVCLMQRRANRSDHRPKIFRGALDPFGLSGPMTYIEVAQALTGRLCKLLPTSPVRPAVFLKEVTVRQGA